MFSSFIFVVNDSRDFDDRFVPAAELAELRLKHKKWPLYKNTRSRNQVQANDKCLIYLAGRGSKAQHFVAHAVVADVDSTRGIESPDPDTMLTEAPVLVLSLSKVSKLNPPVGIKRILDQLSFIKSKKWGGALQGGCKKISQADFELIVRESNK